MASRYKHIFEGDSVDPTNGASIEITHCSSISWVSCGAACTGRSHRSAPVSWHMPPLARGAEPAIIQAGPVAGRFTQSRELGQEVGRPAGDDHPSPTGPNNYGTPPNTLRRRDGPDWIRPPFDAPHDRRLQAGSGPSGAAQDFECYRDLPGRRQSGPLKLIASWRGGRAGGMDLL